MLAVDPSGSCNTFKCDLSVFYFHLQHVSSSNPSKRHRWTSLLAASRHLEKVGPSSAVHFVIWIKFHQFGKILAPPTEYRQHLSKPTADSSGAIFSLTSMNVLGSSCSNSHVTKALHSRKQSGHNICFCLCAFCARSYSI